MHYEIILSYEEKKFDYIINKYVFFLLKIKNNNDNFKL